MSEPDEATPARRSRLARWTRWSWLLLLGVWCLQELVGERHWATAFLVYLPQHIFVPLPLLLWWLSRRAGEPRLARSNLIAVLYAVFILLGFQIDLPTLWPAEGPAVRVLSWNLRGSGDFGAIWQTLRRAEPDVICLQEYGSAQYYELLLDHLPGWDGAQDGELVVLTRCQMVGAGRFELEEQRRGVFQQVTLRRDGHTFDLVNVHFMTAAAPRHARQGPGALRSQLRETNAIRQAQVEQVEAIGSFPLRPTLVVGDFNTPPRGWYYRRMRRHFRDAFADAGWGFGPTFRVNKPVWRIDHVLLSEGIEARRARVLPGPTSDHRPLVVDLRITRLSQ